jgi:hypothetical protein
MEIGIENSDILCTVPHIFDSLAAQCTSIAYFPLTHQLIIIYSNARFLIFDLHEKRPSRYSQEHLLGDVSRNVTKKQTK